MGERAVDKGIGHKAFPQIKTAAAAFKNLAHDGWRKGIILKSARPPAHALRPADPAIGSGRQSQFDGGDDKNEHQRRQWYRVKRAFNRVGVVSLVFHSGGPFG